MGRLINGEWVDSADQVDIDDGEYDRVETTFRKWIEPGSEHPPESNRYHLYISLACPWCHRTDLLRSLKGLKDVVTVDILDPIRRGEGWEFRTELEECTGDSVFGHDFLRDVYTEVDPEFTGRPTAPVLFDTESTAIVNNESAEIMRMLDTAFDKFAENDVTFYPLGYRKEVDRVIEAIYEPINNGVTRTGFAETQEAYNRAVTELFDALDHWNEILSDQRYLAGDVLTEADIAMFTTLYRFDEGYHLNFKCNKRWITDYEHLWPYIRDVYQLPGVSETCNMDHVKYNFYRSEGHKNPSGIIPVGPDPNFDDPHDRDQFPGSPPDTVNM